MKCIGCAESSDGYAIAPGIGVAGEIRFYCDPCARRDRVKMRYWDGRDLDVGGHRDNPDLGASFDTLIFSFDDLARVRLADLSSLFEWVEDAELAAALVGGAGSLQEHVLRALPGDRARHVRHILAGGRFSSSPCEAQAAIVRTVRRL